MAEDNLNDILKTFLDKAQKEGKNPLEQLVENQKGLTCRSWVSKWIEDNETYFNSRGQILQKKHPDRESFDSIRANLNLDYGEAKQQNPRFPRWSDKELTDALNLALKDLLLKEAKKIKDELQFTTSDDSELIKYIQACKKNYTPLDLAVHKQFLRNILRNLHNLETDYQLFLIYKGTQGGGKSMAIRKLSSPFKHTFKSVSFTQLSGNFSYNLFTDNFILFIDELDKAEKTSIELIKNMVTSPDFAAREIYSSRISNLRSKASFIGATNKYLEEVLNDSTGMRRFYQFECDDRMDWKTINKIDYTKIYKSLDFEAEAFTIDFADELNKHQSLLRKETIYEIFLAEKVIEKGTLQVPSHKLYEVFKEWCDYNNLKASTQNYFSRQLTNLGYEKYHTSGQRGWLLSRDPVFRESVLDTKLKSITGGK